MIADEKAEKEKIVAQKAQADIKQAQEKADELAKGPKEQHPSNVSTEEKRVPKPPPVDYNAKKQAKQAQ